MERWRFEGDIACIQRCGYFWCCCSPWAGETDGWGKLGGYLCNGSEVLGTKEKIFEVWESGRLDESYREEGVIGDLRWEGETVDLVMSGFIKMLIDK